MKIISKILMLSAGTLILGLGACKKDYLDRLPTDQVPLEDAFKTTTGLQAAVQGLHFLMYLESDHDQFGQKSVDVMNDLLGEDMPMSKRGAGWFISTANYSNGRSGSGYLWSYYYKFIINANYILQNADSASGPQEEKDNAKGQAHFYKAFAYYNLSLYYQHTYAIDTTLPGVPIYNEVTQTGAARASMGKLYKEIVYNLRQAEKYLDPDNGAPARASKSEINIDVVRGMHARVALSMQDWATADSMAEAARQNYPLMSRKELMAGFNDWGVGAWMWGSYLNEEQTGIYASFLSHFVIELGGYAKLGQQKLINKSIYNPMPHIETSDDGYDLRYDWWTSRPDGVYERFSQRKFTAKTPGSFSSDLCYMRAEEMLLIEAEAKAQMGHLTASKALLDQLMQIRNPKYDADKSIAKAEYVSSRPVSDQDKLLLEIWLQRRIELWGEGFRYTDLKRCAALSAGRDIKNGQRGVLFYSGLHRENSGGDKTVYGSAYPTFSDPFDARFNYRIPTSEINYNRLIVQNP